MTDPDASLGARVARARRAAALTQSDLAEAVDLDRTAVVRIEQGSRRLSVSELARIAEVLGRRVEWFLSGDRPPPTLQALRRKRRAVLRIASAHGATRVMVFGSVARGEAGPDSDIDLVVEMQHGAGLFAQAELATDLSDLLGRRVEVVTPHGLRERIRERVLREAVPL